MKYEILGAIFATIIFILAGFAFWVVPSYFEARTFNKFSKTKATVWDAMWADLRVVPDNSKGESK